MNVAEFLTALPRQEEEEERTRHPALRDYQSLTMESPSGERRAYIQRKLSLYLTSVVSVVFNCTDCLRVCFKIAG